MATQLQDYLWTTLNLFGIEHTEIIPGVTQGSPLEFVYYPFSHSLLSTLLLAGIVYAVVRYVLRRPGAVIYAGATLSHWVVDFIVHRPDLPLAGNETAKVGLGAWNYPVISILIESLIAVGGLFLYLRATRGKGFAGRFGMAILIMVVLLFTIMGMLSASPPPTVEIMAMTGLIMYLVIAGLGQWLDKKRVTAIT